MKRLGYYPALVFWLLMGAVGIGIFGYLTMTVVRRMSNYKGSDAAYKASQEQLEAEQRNLANNQQADKAYSDYFARWAQKEGNMDEMKIRQRLQKLAEELNVTIAETVPLSSPDKEEAAEAAKKDKKPANPRDRLQPPARLTMAPGVLPTPGMVELRVTLNGPFVPLMTLLERLETEMGSLRIVQTRWVARSPEEVRLTVGLRYKMMGGLQ